MESKGSVVYAVGANHYGEFGIAGWLNELTPLNWSNNINITEIYNGKEFAVYRDENNTFYAAGYNGFGSCLHDKSKETPTFKIEGLQNLKISTIYCNPIGSSFQAFIVTHDNNIYAFGRNDSGQLGIGNNKNQHKICRIKWKYGVKQIQCTTQYSIILAQNGTVHSTDYSKYGGNGQKPKAGSKRWTKIKKLANIARIATGECHTLCCDTAGNVYSFGGNNYGQLGFYKTDQESHIKPTLIFPLFQERHLIAVEVCCGSYYSLILTRCGAVYAFGYNQNGECGQGNASKACVLTPTLIQSLSNKDIKKFMCASNHSAAVTAIGTIFMFGCNKYNECIVSDYDGCKNKPVYINNYVYKQFNKQITAIVLGYYNTKLILSQTNININTTEQKEKEEETMNNVHKIQQQEKQQQQITAFNKYNNQIVKELVNVGVGSRENCLSASLLVVNANDINEVRDKVLELQNKQMRSSFYEMDNNEEKVTEFTNNINPTAISSFETQINQLLNIIKNHFNFMSKQEKTVNLMINKSGQQRKKLQNAKIKALDTEKKLLTEIMNITAMNDFLTNIILIENLFNYQYTKKEKFKQEDARKKYAKNISIYEEKSKPICHTLSFVDLLFQAYTDLTAFKDWLKMLHSECNKANIKMISKPEAKQKNIERAFYKTFYVYAIDYGNKAHQRLTDVLRCSLVFDNFDDLYRCFGIIETLTEANGGILRCKDRFNPRDVPFGYRDLLININCPQSQGIVVCEVQLHHELFYKHKSVSHSMYKKARLFEDKYSNNLAYEYADKYIRNNVGDKVYEYGDADAELDGVQLLKEWKLNQYGEILMNDEGYEFPELWKDLCEEELKQMGFKCGHAKQFVKKSANL